MELDLTVSPNEPRKMDVYRMPGKKKRGKKTVCCKAERLRGISFPIHGNEECAINWALRAGGARQGAGGG